MRGRYFIYDTLLCTDMNIQLAFLAFISDLVCLNWLAYLSCLTGSRALGTRGLLLLTFCDQIMRAPQGFFLGGGGGKQNRRNTFREYRNTREHVPPLGGPQSCTAQVFLALFFKFLPW